MTNEQYFDPGYKIDEAYRKADQYLVNSDDWHYWMDQAKIYEMEVKGLHYDK